MLTRNALRSAAEAAVLILVLALPEVFSGGCATREETALAMPDSTFAYPGKRAGDVAVSITFEQKGGTQPAEVLASRKDGSGSEEGSKKNSRRSRRSRRSAEDARRRIEPRAFDIQPDAKVQAKIRIENAGARGDRPLSFHMVWLKPNLRTAFKKRIEIDPATDEPELTSSFSIPPDKRAPGLYRLRVYLFRELVAEKTFELRGTGLEEGEGDEGEI
jgi:hypothetical protein